MKKYLALILALLMVLSTLIACNSNNSDPTASDESQSNLDTDAENGTNSEKNDEYVPKLESSAGLKLMLNSNGKGYTLAGIGTCTDSEIIIDGYQGLPITTIRENAFKGCESIKKISIGDGVNTVGVSAFYGCSNLAQVRIGNAVKAIGDNAFYDCITLESITIGKSLERIGKSAFDSCWEISDVYYNGNIESWCNVDFRDEASNPIQYCHDFYMKNSFDEYEKLEGDIVIPDTVSRIKQYAFYNYFRIRSITLGKNVKNLGKYAIHTYNLESIIVSEDNPTYKSIDGSLYSKNGKTLIFYSIGNRRKIFTVPEGVTKIDTSAFENCTYLTSIILPNTLMIIDDHAFTYCSKLHSIVIPDSVTTLGERVFSYCDNLSSVTLGSGITSIDSLTFLGCDKLVEIVNNSSATFSQSSLMIAEDTIFDVHSGESNIVQKGDYLFYTLDNVHYLINYIGEDTKITLPDDYEGSEYAINYHAFHNNINLEEVTISDGVTNIGVAAFEYCYYLEKITIPSNVTKIGTRAFRNCDRLIVAEFKTVEGWKVAETDISVEELSNKETAAQLLSVTYNAETWERT